MLPSSGYHRKPATPPHSGTALVGELTVGSAGTSLLSLFKQVQLKVQGWFENFWLKHHRNTNQEEYSKSERLHPIVQQQSSPPRSYVHNHQPQQH